MPLDFLRGADDDKVATRFHEAVLAAYADLAVTVGDCPRCHVTETMMLGPLCHQCDDAARDAKAARAMCALLHRGSA
jgi:hypothetical protein